MAISLSSKDEPNPARWVAALAAPSCLDYPPCRRKKSLPEAIYKFSVDQGCSVMMAGYWPGFCFCVYMDLDSFSGKLHWTEQSSWPHAWSITHVHRPSTQPTLSVDFKTSPTYLLFQPQHMDTKQSMEDGHHGLHGTPAIKPAAMESSTG